MRKQSRGRDPTLRGFFLVYISFLVCTLLLFAPVYAITLSTLERSALRTTQDVLRAGLSNLGGELHRATIAASALYANQDVGSLAHQEAVATGAQAFRVRQALKVFDLATAPLESVVDVGILFKNGTLLASGRYFGHSAEFYPLFFADAAHPTFASWRASLARPGFAYAFQAADVRLPGAAYEALIFSLPLPLNTNWHTAIFYATMDRRAILSLLALPDTLENCTLTLADAAGNALLTHAPRQIEQAIAVTDGEPAHGLTVELRVDRAYVADQLRAFRHVLSWLIALGVAAGVLLALGYAWRHARPVRMMRSAAVAASQSAGGALSGLSPLAFANTYQYMNAFIGQVGTAFHDYESALQHQQAQLRENYFERLIRDGLSDQDVRRAVARAFADWPSPARMALIKLLHMGHLEPDEYSAKQIELIRLARRSMPACRYIHFTENLMLLVRACAPGEGPERAEEELRRLKAEILARADIETSAALGAPFEGLDALHTEFRCLAQLLRVHDGPAPGEVVCFERLSADAVPRYVQPRAARFGELLLRGDGASAMTLLDEDLRALAASGYANETDVQQMFYTYRSALQIALCELGPEGEQIELPDYAPKGTLENAFYGVKSCSIRLCAAFGARRQAQNEHFEAQVLAFIDENLNNPDLYVKLVTDRFSLSESSLQRVVREASGQSFFEYVESRRLARARRLLLTTGEPIQQIIRQCGYATQNAFYKAFRRRFGMSPSAARAARKE